MTLDIQTARATIDGQRVDVERLDLILDRTWSPYIQGTAVLGGLLLDLDPDSDSDPRFRCRLEQRFAVGTPAAEIAAQLVGGGEPTYSAWQTDRVNLWGNPRAVAGGAAFANPSTGASSYITDFPGPVTTARRWTANGTNNTRILPMVLGTDTPDQMETVHVLMHVIITGGSIAVCRIAVRASDIGSSTSSVQKDFGTLGPGEYWLELLQPAHSATASATAGVVLTGAASAAGVTVDVTEILVETITDGDYFDGEGVDGELAQDVWSGTPHASTSLQQSRTQTGTGDPVPMTAAEIAAGPWAGLTGAQIAALYETDLNPEPEQPRALTADLSVREVTVNLRDRTTTVTVASDDVKLWDAALVSRYPEPFSATSVRAIVQSILARIGVALADGTADGSLDAPPVLTPGQRFRDFLEPLVQQAGLQLYADEARVFRLVDAEARIPGGITLSGARDVLDASPSIDREAGGYDSVVIEYRWNVAGVQQVDYDVAGPPRPRKTLKLTYEDTPYPGPGAATGVLRRMQRRRREIPVEAVANYDTRPTMGISLSTESLVAASGQVARVVFAYPARTMRVDLYDLEDVSPESVQSIPAGILTSQLPGTTANLKPGEL